MRLNAIGATVALLFILQAAGQEANVEPQDETQTSQPVSEEPIKYVHVLNPGEREYLSPNLIGVQNIAMTFLPLSMNFINIIDAFREIVNGVRYEILLNAVNTEDNNADIICRLVILEKPWLRTQWGDKVRELQHSNCTTEAAAGGNATPLPPNDVNDKYVKSTVFNGGSRNELSDDEMKRLEDQIFPSAISYKRMPSNRFITSTSTATTDDQEQQEIFDTTTLATADVYKNDEEDDESSTSNSANIEQTTVVDEGGADQKVDLQHQTTLTTTTTTAAPELSNDEMKWLDDIFSVGALNFENNLSALTTADKDGQTHDNLQQQKQIEEPVVRRTKRGYKNEVVGSVEKFDNDEAQKELEISLNKLASGDGPSLKVSKVHAATKQIVSGTITKIDCTLIDADGKEERCEVQIWSRIWMKKDGHEITINCPNKELIKKRHSRSVEHAEKKSHKKQNHHNLNKVEHLFSKFQIKYNRRYHTTMERQMRLRIFKQNLQLIKQLNDNEMGSAKYGITEFADLTSTEYKQRTGLWQRDPQKAASTPKATIADIDLPKEFDWRSKGVISSVKNQGNCGSCWAFSVTGNVEGLHAVKTGKLEEYSEQELLDCDTTDSACNGGLPDNAYEAIEKIGGLELESEYPYHARKEQCHFNKTKIHVKVKGHVDLPKNETAMAQWLIANGPISIGINANAMQFYRGGVSHPWHPLCSHDNLDHGVLIVGYGVSEYPSFHKILPYWIVKNSWGGKWGEQGYYRVYRGDNTCGVSEMASSAVLSD